MFALKGFQQEALDDLRQTFLDVWKAGKQQALIVFKSPTGSGKTVMMSQFLRNLSNDPQFDEDIAFLWFTFSPESYEQSKRKFHKYYGGASEIELLDLDDLNRGKLQKNNIFFINWQKIKTSRQENRKIRGDGGETGISFDNFIEKTQKDNRKIVLIVDEAHRETDTELADELTELIDPRIIMRVTATPKNNLVNPDDLQSNRAGWVRVPHEEVVESGLIKEKIVTQTEEDLSATEETDQDRKLLDLAYKNRLELADQYKNLDKDINPLVMIQLPNDYQDRIETMDESKLEVVKQYLQDKGEDNHNVAVWLSDEKSNLENIVDDNSDVNFLIFKQAPATGWDCPRASVLVMFREIGSVTFHKQTLGRILRMPEAKHYPIDSLNIGYLYTNYKRNEILAEYENDSTSNRPSPHHSRRKDTVTPVEIESVILSRTDYNDLGDSFQDIFVKVANSEFGIEEQDTLDKRYKKLTDSGLNLEEPHVSSNLIADAEIENYDNFLEDAEKSADVEGEISSNDLVRLYNLLCFNVISRQNDEDRKYGPVRSWGKIKTALNIWMKQNTDLDRATYYKIIVADLLNSGSSKLLSVIGKALSKYRPIREKEVEKKADKAREQKPIEIPPHFDSFTDLYEERDVNNSAMKPFYIGKDYPGKQNEENFVEYLEGLDEVEWWYKNGDSGSEYFSIDYRDKSKKTKRLFYPDWFVKTENNLYIFDTKAGFTAEEDSTKYKSEALQDWLQDRGGLRGGIVIKDDSTDHWMVYIGKNYSFTGSFDDDWESLSDFIN